MQPQQIEKSEQNKENWIQYYRKSPLKIKTFLLGSVLLSAIVTTGSLFLSWKILTVNRANEEREAALKPPPPPPKVEPIPEYTYGYEIRDLSVPLTDKRGVRSAYAQFVLFLDCPTKEAREAMGLHRARIMDAIFEAAAHVTVEDVNTEAGYRTFKMHLKEILENRLGELAPRDFAIKNWFVR